MHAVVWAHTPKKNLRVLHACTHRCGIIRRINYTRKVRALGCARAEEGNREKKSKGKNKKKKWKEKIKKKLGFPEPLKSVVVKVSMHIYS